MKKQILIGLILLAVFCAAPVFAQKKTADKEDMAAKFNELKAELSSYVEKQCDAFGKHDFEGTPVSFKLDNPDIRDILSFANPYGCNFIVDETAEKSSMDVYADQIPWNTALKKFLEWMNLEVKIEGSKFRIVKSTVDSSTNKKSETKVVEKELYTGALKLNYLPLSNYSRNCYSRRIEYNSPDKFLLLLRKMVSSRGEILVDVRTNALIVIDEEGRVKNILEFVKRLDQSGFTLEEIVNNPNFEIK